jgi:hypothetical protein
VECARCNRALAKEAGADAVLALHAVSQCQGHCHRQATADNRIAAIEAPFAVEQVHGAAAAMGTAIPLAKHLGHDGIHRYAAHQRITVLAVGRDDIVLRRQGMQRAHSDRFLADIQVKEAADVAGPVKLCRLFLQAADAQHVGQQGQARILIMGDAHGRNSSASPTQRPPPLVMIGLPA